MLFFIDPRLALAIGLAAGAFTVAIERPVLGVCFLIAGRLTSTGANAWVRIGRVNIDLFEPSLLLCLVALFVHATLHQRRIWVSVPWRPWVLGFLVWQVIGLVWCTDPGEWAAEVLATAVLLTTTLVILAFVDSTKMLVRMLHIWIATSTIVALLGMTGVMSQESAFEMASGSRASGFGQHPNWYAMNLLFAIHPALALAWLERRNWMRMVLMGAAVTIFVAQLGAGSRGGLLSVLIGGFIAGAASPRFRRPALIATVAIVSVVAVVVLFDVGSVYRAYERALTLGTALAGRSVRVSNWLVCWQILIDSWGVGIGAGGYEQVLGSYDQWLYESQYRYPHGIFWGAMAHYGVVGLFLFTAFSVTVARMGLQAARQLRGRDESVLAWAMWATMAGYFVWSFVEFSYDDKPFWEFLALFSALWVISGKTDD